MGRAKPLLVFQAHTQPRAPSRAQNPAWNCSGLFGGGKGDLSFLATFALCFIPVGMLLPTPLQERRCCSLAAQEMFPFSSGHSKLFLNQGFVYEKWGWRRAEGTALFPHRAVPQEWLFHGCPRLQECSPWDSFGPGAIFWVSSSFVPPSFRHKTSLEELQPLLPTFPSGAARCFQPSVPLPQTTYFR